MYIPSVPRFKGLIVATALTLCSLSAVAAPPRVNPDNSRIFVAQVSETNDPTETPAVERGHDGHTATPALPNLNPRINKKRVAFWGIAFMSATSVAFVIFGVWAMRRAPKPGQQRPG